jgi:ribonuclease VapC
MGLNISAFWREGVKIIDCAAHALAKTRDLPLLRKGNDFASTDIRQALPSRP